jgi:hypothetical protein
MSGWGDDVLDTLEGDGMDGALAAFVEQLRGLAEGPVAEPSVELAALLAGPNAEVAPLRRRRRLTLNRLAAAAAAVIIVVGGAAAQRELPEPAQGVVSDVVDQLTPFHVDEWHWHPTLPTLKLSEKPQSAPAVEHHPSPASTPKPHHRAHASTPLHASRPTAVLAAARVPKAGAGRRRISATHFAASTQPVAAPGHRTWRHPPWTGHRSWPHRGYGRHHFGDPRGHRSGHARAHYRPGHRGHNWRHRSGHHRHW